MSMRTKDPDILDVALFAAGVDDALKGLAPDDPESRVSMYNRGRLSIGIGAAIGNAICGTPQ